MTYIVLIQCKRGLLLLNKPGIQEAFKNTNQSIKSSFKNYSVFNIQRIGMHNLRLSF